MLHPYVYLYTYIAKHDVEFSEECFSAHRDTTMKMLPAKDLQHFRIYVLFHRKFFCFQWLHSHRQLYAVATPAWKLKLALNYYKNRFYGLSLLAAMLHVLPTYCVLDVWRQEIKEKNVFNNFAFKNKMNFLLFVYYMNRSLQKSTCKL